MNHDYAPAVLVHPIRSMDDLERVRAAAKLDAHEVPLATHYVVKDSEIVGAFHAGPVVGWWLHSKKCHRADSRIVLAVLESILAAAGIYTYQMMCAPDSPYIPKMQEFGYTEVGTTVIFRKDIPHV